jgi:protoporphyrin/coproporphyrin ferrochelatase
VDYVGPWFDHPLFIDAIAQRVQNALKTMPAEHQSAARWFFTAHSIPCAMAKGSTYVQELRRTAELVCQKLGQDEWDLAYSSRSGNPLEPWLEPDVCDLIAAEAQDGATAIFFIPIGFIADHVEILFDLDVEAKQAARQAGIALYRSQSVGDHPLFCRMMAEVARARMDQPEAAEQRSSILTRFADGRQESMVGPSAQTCYCQPLSADPPCVRWAQKILKPR